MAVIAARKPYYITHFGQTLDIDLYIYDFEATPPTIGVDDPTYTLRKVSFADGVDENLRLDLSPYIRDYFDHSGAIDDFSLPDGGQKMSTNMYLKVDAVVNTVEENHTALDGWLEMGLSTTEGITDYERVSFGGTQSYVTFKKGSFTSVRYTSFDGSTNTYALNSTANGYLIITPQTPTFEAGKNFTMELIGSKTATYTFNMQCPFENQYSYSVGFVNKWGLVEWIDMSGGATRTLKTTSSNYIASSDYTDHVYNKDGKYSLRLNTGWVQGESPDMVESLMMSQQVWVNTGSAGGAVYYQNQIVPARVMNQGMEIKDSRRDKLINYTFDFELTPSIIYG